MAYDEGLAQRVREHLETRDDVSEKRMFGGLAFLLAGNMSVGVNGDDLMVRVGPNAYRETIALEHAREMDFTGRPLTGFVYVGVEGVESDTDLAAWVSRGVAFAASLPPK
jgi:hypothetical protein